MAEFLETFDLNTMIEILDTQDGEIYHGEVGEVKLYVLNAREVILGTTCVSEKRIRIFTEKQEDWWNWRINYEHC